LTMEAGRSTTSPAAILLDISVDKTTIFLDNLYFLTKQSIQNNHYFALFQKGSASRQRPDFLSIDIADDNIGFAEAA
jgi:hypothetical protein